MIRPESQVVVIDVKTSHSRAHRLSCSQSLWVPSPAQSQHPVMTPGHAHWSRESTPRATASVQVTPRHGNAAERGAFDSRTCVSGDQRVLHSAQRHSMSAAERGSTHIRQGLPAGSDEAGRQQCHSLSTAGLGHIPNSMSAASAIDHSKQRHSRSTGGIDDGRACNRQSHADNGPDQSTASHGVLPTGQDQESSCNILVQIAEARQPSSVQLAAPDNPDDYINPSLIRLHHQYIQSGHPRCVSFSMAPGVPSHPHDASLHMASALDSSLGPGMLMPPEASHTPAAGPLTPLGADYPPADDLLTPPGSSQDPLTGLSFVLGASTQTLGAAEALRALSEGQMQCALTGDSFEYLLQHCELSVLETVMRNAVVFARMKPYQKGQVMDLLGTRGLYQMIDGQSYHIQVIAMYCYMHMSFVHHCWHHCWYPAGFAVITWSQNVSI